MLIFTNENLVSPGDILSTWIQRRRGDNQEETNVEKRLIRYLTLSEVGLAKHFTYGGLLHLNRKSMNDILFNI